MIIITAKKKKRDLEDEIEVLSKVKDELKKNDIAKEICKEHGFDIDIVDGIPIDFESDLEASAKTVDSRIFLNENLFDEEFDIIMRYVIHELVHALQHMKLTSDGDPYENHDYLDRPDEMEAFQYQIKFEEEEAGMDDVLEYVEELLEYHKIPKKKKNSKKKELLEKLDD